MATDYSLTLHKHKMEHEIIRQGRKVQAQDGGPQPCPVQCASVLTGSV